MADKKTAGEALEVAIREWLRVSYPENNDMVIGWVLLTELISVEGDPSISIVEISSSDGMSLPHQIGIIGYADTIARDYVTRPPV